MLAKKDISLHKTDVLKKPKLLKKDIQLPTQGLNTLFARKLTERQKSKASLPTKAYYLPGETTLKPILPHKLQSQANKTNDPKIKDIKAQFLQKSQVSEANDPKKDDIKPDLLKKSQTNKANEAVKANLVKKSQGNKANESKKDDNKAEFLIKKNGMRMMN